MPFPSRSSPTSFRGVPSGRCVTRNFAVAANHSPTPADFSECTLMSAASIRFETISIMPVVCAHHFADDAIPSQNARTVRDPGHRFIPLSKCRNTVDFSHAYRPNHVGSGSKLTIFSSPEPREHIRILARSLSSPQVPSTFPQLLQVISASCPHTTGTAIEAPPQAGHIKCTVIPTPSLSRLFPKASKGQPVQSIA